MANNKRLKPSAEASKATESVNRTPFLAGLRQYDAEGIVRFHTPGHKGGVGLLPVAEAFLGSSARYDVSDVLSSTTYNDSWSEALQAAESLAAEAFGAKATRFAINGTTGALHAMLLAVRMQGYTQVVMPRSAHLSIFGGLILADLEPVYVSDTTVRDWGVPLPPHADEMIGEAHAAGVDKPIFLTTYPNYYGIGVPLDALGSHAEQSGGLLLVDEAHGPHFRFHPRLPRPALEQGADLVAQSTHKVLGALTQASMLHVGTDRVAIDGVERALFWLQSTSPSALLLASLDAAREQMATEGTHLWERALAMADAFECRLMREGGIRLLTTREIGEGYVKDPTRLVVRTADVGWHGVAAAQHLRRRGIQVEMADPWHVVAILTWADDEEKVDRLAGELLALRDEPPQRKPPYVNALPPRPQVTPRLRPREAAIAPTRRVRLREAIGAISADVVCPYPPGVPVLCPGEEIDAAVVEYLEVIDSLAFEVRGTCDPQLEFIHICE